VNTAAVHNAETSWDIRDHPRLLGYLRAACRRERARSGIAFDDVIGQIPGELFVRGISMHEIEERLASPREFRGSGAQKGLVSAIRETFKQLRGDPWPTVDYDYVESSSITIDPVGEGEDAAERMKLMSRLRLLMDDCSGTREMQVVKLLAQGRTYREIADVMGLSKSTVHDFATRTITKFARRLRDSRA
jgi:DNA-directed RNA polymerase specialized sigma24 family protein